ncbi:MAG: pilin, partial [Candidatus Paceibacterota bacterium]
MAPMVFAQGDINQEVYDIGIGFQDEYPTDEGISNLINDIYRNALIIGGIAAVAVIIYGAIYLTISGASPDKQKEGKDIITSAIWGVILLFGAFILLNTINPQLVEIDPPGGEQAPTNTQELSQNSIDSCIVSVPNAEYEECKQRVVVHGEATSPPTCEDEFSRPVRRTSNGDGYSIFCEHEISSNNTGTPSCEEGTPTFASGRVVCSVDNAPSKTIDHVGDCGGIVNYLSGGCKDNIEKKTVIIESGGAYAQALYYPKNGDPSQAQCLVYDYQISEAHDIERAGL